MYVCKFIVYKHMYVNFIMCVPFREKATKLNNILIKSYFLEVFPCK